MGHPILTTSSGAYPVKERLFFLDTLKAISIIAVVSYHSIFIPHSNYAENFSLIDTLFAPLRFCVPVLLTISFLLSQRSLDRQPMLTGWQLLGKRFARLAIPTVFWVGIAAGLKLIKHDPLIDILHEILKGEIFMGAYYLLILFQLTLIYIGFRRWLESSQGLLLTIFIQCLVFVAIDALLVSQSNIPLVSALREIDRPLVIYWFGYIALGVACYQMLPKIIKLSNQISIPLKVILLLIMAGLLIAEYGWLGQLTQHSIPPFDYGMLSCLLSVPIMILCFASLKESHFSPLLKTAILVLSKYSLGIFCINGILSQIFLSIGSHWVKGTAFSFSEVLMLKLISWGVLLGISLATAMALSRIGLKTVVS
ncbi:MAG: acyltransferase [Kovacikia sp.]